MRYSIRNFKAYTIMPKACATDMKEEKVDTALISENALPEECQRTSSWMLQALRSHSHLHHNGNVFGNFPSFLPEIWGVKFYPTNQHVWTILRSFLLLPMKHWLEIIAILVDANLLQNIRSVVLDPFFKDLSSPEEDNVHVGYHNSFSSCRNPLIFCWMSVVHCYAIGDLVDLSDLVFHDCLDVGESPEKPRFIFFFSPLCSSILCFRQGEERNQSLWTSLAFMSPIL